MPVFHKLDKHATMTERVIRFLNDLNRYITNAWVGLQPAACSLHGRKGGGQIINSELCFFRVWSMKRDAANFANDETDFIISKLPSTVSPLIFVPTKARPIWLFNKRLRL